MERVELVQQASRGNRTAIKQLFPLVYNELRELASKYLRRERDGHTLQPTSLVHEVFLRLMDQAKLASAEKA